MFCYWNSCGRIFYSFILLLFFAVVHSPWTVWRISFSRTCCTSYWIIFLSLSSLNSDYCSLLRLCFSSIMFRTLDWPLDIASRFAWIFIVKSRSFSRLFVRGWWTTLVLLLFWMSELNKDTGRKMLYFLLFLEGDCWKGLEEPLEGCRAGLKESHISCLNFSEVLLRNLSLRALNYRFANFGFSAPRSRIGQNQLLYELNLVMHSPMILLKHSAISAAVRFS